MPGEGRPPSRMTLGTRVSPAEVRRLQLVHKSVCKTTWKDSLTQGIMKTIQGLVRNQWTCPMEWGLHYAVTLNIITQTTRRSMQQGSAMNNRSPLSGEVENSLSQMWLGIAFVWSCGNLFSSHIIQAPPMLCGPGCSCSIPFCAGMVPSWYQCHYY